jgi:hypothetical protein
VSLGLLGKGQQYTQPPNSVMRVGAQLSESMAGEYIVKAATKGEILIPRTLHKEGDNPVLCLINQSDHYVQYPMLDCIKFPQVELTLSKHIFKLT